VRALLSTWPWLALRIDTKQPAALGGLLAGIGYVAISGLEVAAIRACIMTSCLMLGLCAYRPSHSLCSLSLAAWFILLAMPEAAIDPSFQMSFAAVLALVASYPLLLPHYTRLSLYPFWHRCWFWIGAAVLSSLIASLATAPFSLYHFHRQANYSVIANTLALPLSSLVIMPAALLTLVLYPLDADYLPLYAMHYGITALISIGTWTAALPGAVSYVPAMSDTVMLCIVLSFLLACCYRIATTVMAALCLGFGIVLFAMEPRPLLYYHTNPDQWAFATKAGVIFSGSNRHSFLKDMWASSAGQETPLTLKEHELLLLPYFVCTKGLCSFMPSKKTHIAIINADFDPLCPQADIVILLHPFSLTCPAKTLRIMPEQMQKGGTLTVFSSSPPYVQFANTHRYFRPWNATEKKSKFLTY
jgi:competence protein ComEC